MPGLQAGSPVRVLQEAIDRCFSPSLSVSVFLSLKKYIKSQRKEERKEKKKEKKRLVIPELQDHMKSPPRPRWNRASISEQKDYDVWSRD